MMKMLILIVIHCLDLVWGCSLYYKVYLSLMARNDLSFMQKRLDDKLSANNKNCFVTCFYRSSSQNHEHFDTFVPI